MVDGVTTNPSLISRTKSNFEMLVQDICTAVNGPVSIEVTSIIADEMIREGEKLSQIAPNLVVKLPLTWEGLIACRELTIKNVKVNMTLCFSVNQALLAAKAGATYVSPFIGRLDDIGEGGVKLIKDIINLYKNYPYFSTQVLAASIRNLVHVEQVALLGCNAATLPPNLLKEMIKHKLTETGLKKFLDDWKEYEQI